MLANIVFVLALALLGCQGEQSPQQILGRSSNLFTADIYKRLAADKSKDIVFSGLSAHIILSLVAEGAKGDTQRELFTGLRTEKNDEQRKSSYRELTSHLLNTKTEKLKILSANKIFPAQGFPIADSFKDTAVNIYHSDVQTLNYKNAVEATNIINEWVEEHTEHKIENLIDAKEVEPDTKMILVNTLYFSGKWEESFNKYTTKQQNFYTSDNAPKPMNFMNDEIYTNWGYSESHKAQFLELPFKDNKVSMVFVLPDNNTDLALLEENMESLFEQKDIFKRGHVVISLPKFRIESTLRLESALKQMGIQKLFDDDADLTGISQDERLKADYIIQKAFIDVNEEGVEAAASTAVKLVPMALYQTLAVFKADHPFLWFIRDIPSGTVLFSGRFQG